MNTYGQIVYSLQEAENMLERCRDTTERLAMLYLLDAIRAVAARLAALERLHAPD